MMFCFVLFFLGENKSHKAVHFKLDICSPMSHRNPSFRLLNLHYIQTKSSGHLLVVKIASPVLTCIVLREEFSKLRQDRFCSCRRQVMQNSFSAIAQTTADTRCLLQTGESREIYHFHYTTWPDFGVPESPASFLNFLFKVRESGSLGSEHGPSVVHCSAGIGRSGTFALVDTCLVLVSKVSAIHSQLKRNVA